MQKNSFLYHKFFCLVNNFGFNDLINYQADTAIPARIPDFHGDDLCFIGNVFFTWLLICFYSSIMLVYYCTVRVESFTHPESSTPSLTAICKPISLFFVTSTKPTNQVYVPTDTPSKWKVEV